MLKRVPLFLPAYPVLSRFPARPELHHSGLAMSRGGQDAYEKEFRLSFASVAFVGVLIIAGNVFCGVQKQAKAWPFACYPTFSNLRDSTFEELTVEVQMDEENTAPVPLRELMIEDTPMREGRFNGLMTAIIGWGWERDRLNALWKFMAEEDPSWASVQKVTFYKVRRRSAPEYWEEPPVAREVVYEFNPEKGELREASR